MIDEIVTTVTTINILVGVIMIDGDDGGYNDNGTSYDDRDDNGNDDGGNDDWMIMVDNGGICM